MDGPDLHFTSLFHEATHCYEWEWGRDVSWVFHLYKDCVTKHPLRESFSGGREVGANFKFDFIVFSQQDGGSDLDHLYGFSTTLCKSKTKRRQIRDIAAILQQQHPLTKLPENVPGIIESLCGAKDVFQYDVPFVSDDSSQ